MDLLTVAFAATIGKHLMQRIEPCPSNPYTPYSGIVAAFRRMAWQSYEPCYSNQIAP